VYRIGIDVGGTFTKAVAIDSKNLKLAGKATVPTTYDPTEGVSLGILTSLQRLLETKKISPREIELLAFSTTHAVNSLLEGDVTPVGIITMGPPEEKSSVIKRTRLGDLELNQGKKLKTFYKFIDISDSGLEGVEKTITEMVDAGAKAIVASEAFGVDNPENEDKVKEIAGKLGIPCVAGHEVSGTYGLEIRTITAAINASILPRMIEVAERLEKSVRDLGIKVPIMVMKCDGGLAPLEILKTKPLFTLLSGPAASVVGTHLYTSILDGIVIEVGGTTTNISVVKNGKPEMKYIDVLGHPTTIRSMDVRILPVGGGDLVRIKGRKIVDVGPRSARIAGFPYAAYESPDKLSHAKITRIAPKKGDPDDYITLETPQGKYALTLTCASNYLEIPPPDDYARGNRASAQIAINTLSESLRVDGRKVAEEILKKASKKIEDVIKSLIKEYKLDPQNTVLLGVGGGASVIIPYTAKKMGLPFKIPEHEEVISSAGTAMAMVREELEKNIDEYHEKEVLTLVEKAKEAIIKRGAMPETVSISTEYIPEMKTLRVIALGSIAGNSRLTGKLLNEKEAVKIVNNILNNEKPELAAKTKYYFIFKHTTEKKILFLKRKKDKIVVIDRLGRIHLVLEDGIVINSNRNALLQDIKLHLDSKKGPANISPNVYVVNDSKVVDLSIFTRPDQIFSAISSLAKKTRESEVVVLIGK